MEDVEPLYETPDTGLLQVDSSSGKAYRFNPNAQNSSVPSLSGPYTGPGSVRGLGGSTLGPGDFSGVLPGGSGQGVPKVPVARQLSPEELMAMADQMGSQMRMEHEARMAEGPAVRPEEYDPTPAWLDNYMQKVPVMGTMQVDNYGLAKHSYERDQLKKLKSQL